MADVLYGALGGPATTSDLYTIDPGTGVATSVGPIGMAMTGMAVDPTTGILYGVTNENSAVDADSLISIDPDTGAGTFIASLGGNVIVDIAFDSLGQLWGWNNGPDDLYAIDKTNGTMVSAGNSGLSTAAVGMDFDASDVLYGALRGTGRPLYTVDTNTGAPTAGPNITGGGFSLGSSIACAAFEPTKTLLYATVIVSQVSKLVTIDLTGALTVIGPSEGPPPFDALAWLTTVPPPPTPGTMPSAAQGSRLFITSKTSRTLSLLDKRATNRQFLFTLNAPAYHTGQVASDDQEINRSFPNADDPSLLTHNRRLIYWLRRETRADPSDPPYVCRFGGIVMTLEDDGADAPTTRYTAYDPWQYMMSRPIRDDTGALPGIAGLKYPPQSRASDIAVDLLLKSEIFDGETHIEMGGSSFPLVETSSQLPYGIRFDQGLSVGEAWQQLVDTGTIDIHLPPLYDPINSPGKVCEFEIVAQAIGTAAGPVQFDQVMSWDGPGHSLMGISRMIDGTRLANKVQYFAGQGGVKVPLQTDATSVSDYGVYFSQQFFPGSHDRTTVALLAVAALAIRRNGIRSITVDPAPERVSLALRDYREGDYLPIWASRNLREPIGVDYNSFDANAPGACGYQRVYVIPVELDDNGIERVRGLLVSKDSVVDS